MGVGQILADASRASRGDTEGAVPETTHAGHGISVNYVLYANGVPVRPAAGIPTRRAILRRTYCVCRACGRGVCRETSWAVAAVGKGWLRVLVQVQTRARALEAHFVAAALQHRPRPIRRALAERGRITYTCHRGLPTLPSRSASSPSVAFHGLSVVARAPCVRGALALALPSRRGPTVRPATAAVVRQS